MSDCSQPTSGTLDSLPARVCVIEEDIAIVELVTSVLDDENINVEVCPLGWQAHLGVRKNLPKVVILDAQMPGVSGIQLFYMLRADRMTASIPVIFLTTNPQKVREELPNYEELGAMILSKPFDILQLLDLLQVAVTP